MKSPLLVVLILFGAFSVGYYRTSIADGYTNGWSALMETSVGSQPEAPQAEENDTGPAGEADQPNDEEDALVADEDESAPPPPVNNAMVPRGPGGGMQAGAPLMPKIPGMPADVTKVASQDEERTRRQEFLEQMARQSGQQGGSAGSTTIANPFPDPPVPSEMEASQLPPPIQPQGNLQPPGGFPPVVESADDVTNGVVEEGPADFPAPPVFDSQAVQPMDGSFPPPPIPDPEQELEEEE
jgi:hypothetical protein